MTSFQKHDPLAHNLAIGGDGLDKVNASRNQTLPFGSHELSPYPRDGSTGKTVDPAMILRYVYSIKPFNLSIEYQLQEWQVITRNQTLQFGSHELSPYLLTTKQSGPNHHDDLGLCFAFLRFFKSLNSVDPFR